MAATTGAIGLINRINRKSDRQLDAPNHNLENSRLGNLS
jgi:hypothetical protein